jgi:hypothetical protein
MGQERTQNGNFTGERNRQKGYHSRKNRIGGQIPEEIGTKAYADLSTKNRWKRNLPRLIEAIRRGI